MGLRFMGPASTLQLGDGTVVKRGDPVTLDDATRAALEKAGSRFKDDDAAGPSQAMAPQSAAENLAQQGLTPEQAAANAGLSASTGQQVAPQQQPTQAPARPPKSS